jgi:integrase
MLDHVVTPQAPLTRGAEAEDWCYGDAGPPAVVRLTAVSWLNGRALIPWAGGASEDGGRRYCPQRASRPPGAPEGRALDGRWVHVRRVAVEVAGNVTSRPYPKTHHAVRSVPLPAFVIEAMRTHVDSYPPIRTGEVFTNEAGGPLRRTLFRSRVWRPALVRAGLLGKVIHQDDESYRAVWQDAAGVEHTAVFRSEARAVREVANEAHGGLTFHQLRHSYATWLVSDGVPVNDVQRLMGHSRASTTLDLYTHFRKTLDPRVADLFADDSLKPGTWPLSLGFVGGRYKN